VAVDVGEGDRLVLAEKVIPPWVRRGGGLVTTSWVAWYLEGMPYDGLRAVLPVLPGYTYHTEPTIQAIEGHPVTEGVPLLTADYASAGGGLREGATPLLRVDDTFFGAAWGFDDGRVVFLGHNYLGPWLSYDNGHQRLLDGSQPEAERLLLQAIEWGGRLR
jgi:hypothetical protein